MATLFPSVCAGPEVERQVYTALERNLPAAWTVWHGIAYSALAGTAEGEGEIDFICAHPHHGIVLIEVKGGVLDVREGRWFQDGRRLRESPALQATRHRHALIGILQQALHVHALPFPVAHALCFPACGRPTVEPLECAGITLTIEDLSAPEPFLLRLLAAEGRTPTAPLPMEALHRCFLPAVRYAPNWQTRRSLAEAQIAKLTAEQARTLDAFRAFSRLRVRGCAGSGKTLLALRRAAQLAAEGKKVLLLCFNVLLADHLARLTAQMSPGLEATAINPFLCRLLNRTDDGSREFWHTLAADALPFAQRLAEEHAYDAVIVDEGQDLSPALWKVVTALVPSDAHFIIFYDPDQNIFQRDLSAIPSFPWPEAILSVNCRNTRRVFETLRPYLVGTIAVSPEAPVGEPPEVYTSVTKSGVRARLRAVLSNLLAQGITPPEILLLGAHTLPKMDLANLLVEVPGLRYFSYRKFKGLEAPVLILVDVDERNPLWNREALYTAISRAIHKIILLRLDPTETP